MVQVDSSCLLHYAFQQSPDGLRCSYDQTHTQNETIELTISNTRRDGKVMNVKQITIIFPMGPNQANTMTASTDLGYNVVPSNTYNITQPSPGQFVIKPLTGSYMQWLDQGLYIRFTGIVMNTTLGTCKVQVIEDSALQSLNFTSQTGWYWFGKYPYQFFMRNLALDRIFVNANESVNLTWEASANANYTMYWNAGGILQSQDVTNLRSWQSPPLQQDTFFQLVGITVDGVQQTQKLEVNVKVANPVLSYSAINLQGGPVSINFEAAIYAYQNFSGSLKKSDQHSYLYQSFYSLATGNLAYVDLYSYEDMSNVTVSLLSGPSNGVKTAWKTTVHLKKNDWTRVPCTTTVAVTENSPYAIQVQSPSGHKLILGSNTSARIGNPVPGYSDANIRLEVGLQPASTGGLNVTTEGLVGIGIAQPLAPLDVNGNVRAFAFVEPSDISLKQNIHPLDGALASLLQMRGVQYERRDTGQQEIGLIAQELAAIYPALVHEDAHGLSAVAYSRLTAVLVEALKSLHGEVAGLKEELAQLRKQSDIN